MAMETNAMTIMLLILAILCFVFAAYLLYVGLTDTYSSTNVVIQLGLAHPYSFLWTRLLAGAVLIAVGVWLLI
jgi:hypothetical protein